MPRFRTRRMSRRRPRRRRRRGRMVRRRLVMDPERKDVTTTLVIPIPNIGAFFSLTDIDQGVTTTSRIGRQAVITGVNATMEFTGGATLIQGLRVRIMLVLDKTPAGAQFSVQNMFADAALPTVSLRNLDQTRRLRVLWSKLIRFDAGLPSRNVTLNKNLRVTTRYAGTGAGINNVISNGLTLFIISNVAILAEQPVMAISVRTRFVG